MRKQAERHIPYMPVPEFGVSPGLVSFSQLYHQVPSASLRKDFLCLDKKQYTIILQNTTIASPF